MIERFARRSNRASKNELFKMNILSLIFRTELM